MTNVVATERAGPNGPLGSSIEVRGVRKTYRADTRQPIPALREMSFEVRPGEFVCVVGPSGCGKSTLLRIIGGISTATSGEVYVDGTRVVGPRRDVGFVFQDPTLLPWRTVLENAMLGAEVIGLDYRRARQRAAELISLVGLGGFENCYPRELSGGMQQRAGIVRALVHEPKLILLDEPFGALDALTRENMGFELLRIWEANKASIVMVTHSVPEALLLADRVIVCSSRPGRILDVVDTGLPRPRSLDMLNSAQLATHATHLRELLGSRGELAA